MREICQELIDTIEKKCMPTATTTEAQVFFLKLKGDYHRCLSEFLKGEQHKEAADQAKESYHQATTEAEKLKTTHPIRLGLALNYSVYYYEILNSPEHACKLAKTAFDSAIAELDGLEEDEYRDAAAIMQLIRDNLTLWTSDHGEEKGLEGMGQAE